MAIGPFSESSGLLQPGVVTLRLVAGQDYSKAQTASFYWDGSTSAAREAISVINSVSGGSGISARLQLSKEDSVFNYSLIQLESIRGDNIHIINDSDPSVFFQLLDANVDFFGNAGQSNFTTPQFGTEGAGMFGVDDTWATGVIFLESNSRINLTPDGMEDEFGDQYGYFLRNDPDSFYSLDQVSFSSASQASRSLKIFDGAIEGVSSARAELGAVQSRLESVISNLQTSAENLYASRSRIRDTDYAAETADLARQQILQQAGTAMLAQANQFPQQVLRLLQI